MTPNRIHLDALRGMGIGDLAALPGDQLALLQHEAGAALRESKAMADWIDGAIVLKYADQAQSARAAVGKDTGTVRFEDGPVTVVADLPKRIDWAQEKLAALVDQIRADGADPADYVDVTFSVPERKYTAWPTHLREAFEPARTVRTGKPKIRLLLGEEAS